MRGHMSMFLTRKLRMSIHISTCLWIRRRNLPQWMSGQLQASNLALINYICPNVCPNVRPSIILFISPSHLYLSIYLSIRGISVRCEQRCPCIDNCDCPRIMRPVCGDDRRTYDNSCQAQCRYSDTFYQRLILVIIYANLTSSICLRHLEGLPFAAKGAVHAPTAHVQGS